MPVPRGSAANPSRPDPFKITDTTHQIPVSMFCRVPPVAMRNQNKNAYQIVGLLSVLGQVLPPSSHRASTTTCCAIRNKLGITLFGNMGTSVQGHPLYLLDSTRKALKISFSSGWSRPKLDLACPKKMAHIRRKNLKVLVVRKLSQSIYIEVM